MGLLAMSSTELGRVGVLRDVDANRMTPADAASVLNLSERQVFRLLQLFRKQGASGLVSRRRGKPSNQTLRVLWFVSILIQILHENSL